MKEAASAPCSAHGCRNTPQRVGRVVLLNSSGRPQFEALLGELAARERGVAGSGDGGAASSAKAGAVNGCEGLSNFGHGGATSAARAGAVNGCEGLSNYGYGGEPKCYAVLNAEHHALGTSFVDLQYRAKARGWKFDGAEATLTDDGGRSAGTGIAVRSVYGLASGSDLDGTCDVSPVGSPGRLSAVWTNAVLPRGLLLVSAYFWTGEGLTERNLRLLERAGDVARAFGGLFLIGGDFNMTPEELDAMRSWLDRMGVAVVRPEGPTCHSGRTIDFFLVDRRLLPLVLGVHILLDADTSPHYPVALDLKLDFDIPLITVFASPAPFPKERKVGCLRPPRPPVDERFAAAETATRDDPSALDALWKHVAELAEYDLCGLFDFVRDDGAPTARYAGRGGELRLVQRPLIPPDAKELGPADAVTRALWWFATRGTERVAAASRVQAGSAVRSESFNGHWRAVGVRLRTSGHFRVLVAHDAAWSERLLQASFLSPDDASGASTLKEAVVRARAEAKERKRKAGAAAAASWKAFTEEQRRTGAGVLHAFIKRDRIEPDAPVEVRGEKALDPQSMANHDASTWKPIWERFASSADAPWRGAKVDAADRPPRPLPAELRAAALRYKKRTGVGVDNLWPRWVAWLNDSTLDALSGLLYIIEGLGFWPSAVMATVMKQIPKKTGGRRPIGLLATLVRIWEKLRKPLVVEWRQQAQYDFNAAANGESSERAVWRQSLLAEAAVARGDATAGVLVDLVKAFEQVHLSLVWHRARELHFPVPLLVLILESFAFARYVAVGKAVAAPIYTLSAILAGGSFATDSLLVVLAPVVLALLEKYPVRATLWVDDLSMHAYGSHEHVEATIDAAAEFVIERLEGDLRMVVSRGERGKSVAVASGGFEGRQLARRLWRHGIRLVPSAPNLGVDFAAGKRAPRGILRARASLAKVRFVRARRIGGQAGPQVFLAGPYAGIRYGRTVAPSSTAEIFEVQRMATSCDGNPRGRSLLAAVALSGRPDPGLALAMAPVRAWADEAWDMPSSLPHMAVAWRAAVPAVGLSLRPVQAADGPSAAMVASVLRIGWKTPASTVLVTRRGETLDLTIVCPCEVAKFFGRDFRAWAAAGSDVAGEVGGIPDFQALNAVVRSKAGAPSAKASLRALGEGRWWTQSRLHAAGLVSDPFCRACGQAAGTIFHRCAACPRLDATMEEHRDKAILRAALRSPDDPLFRRGLPRAEEPAAAVPDVRRWSGGPGSGDYFSGEVFTDGSLIRAMPVEARRGGWAVACTDGRGSLRHALYGTAPDPFPASLRSELWALERGLDLAVPPVCFRIDNQSVVDGVAKGRRWCTSSRRPHADRWRAIWRKLEDIGDGVDVLKIKAHARLKSLPAGMTADEWYGNEFADRFAKAGAKIAELLAPTASARASFGRAKRWYRWLLRVIADWPADVDPPGVAAPAPPTAPVRRGARLHRTSPHHLLARRAGLRCTLCGRKCDKWSADIHRLEARIAQLPAGHGDAEVLAAALKATRFKADLARRRFAASPCLGAPVGRVLAAAQDPRVAAEDCAREGWEPTVFGASPTKRRRFTGKQKDVHGVYGPPALAPVVLDPALDAARTARIAATAKPILGDGHRLFVSGPVLWCRRCGLFGEHRLRGLRAACQPEALNAQRRTNLDRLMAGRHPRSNGALPRAVAYAVPIPVTAAAEDAVMHSAAMRAARVARGLGPAPGTSAAEVAVGQEEADAIAAVLASAPRGRVDLRDATFVRAEPPGWTGPDPAAGAALAPAAATPDAAAQPGPAAQDPPCDDDDGDLTSFGSASSISADDCPTAEEIAAGVAREAAAAARPVDACDDVPVLSDEDDVLLATVVPPRIHAPLRREPAWLAPYRARKARRLEAEAHLASLADAWRRSQDEFGRLAAARPSWDW